MQTFTEMEVKWNAYGKKLVQDMTTDNIIL
jgi:hypothetical protein